MWKFWHQYSKKISISLKKSKKSVIYVSSFRLATITLITGISLSLGISWLVWQQEQNDLKAKFQNVKIS